MYRRTLCESIGQNVSHDNADANDAEVDVGDDAHRRRIREELVDNEVKRLEKLGIRDERPAASMKA